MLLVLAYSIKPLQPFGDEISYGESLLNSFRDCSINSISLLLSPESIIILIHSFNLSLQNFGFDALTTSIPFILIFGSGVLKPSISMAFKIYRFLAVHIA